MKIERKDDVTVNKIGWKDLVTILDFCNNEYKDLMINI